LQPWAKATGQGKAESHREAEMREDGRKGTHKPALFRRKAEDNMKRVTQSVAEKQRCAKMVEKGFTSLSCFRGKAEDN